jgi:hypothetical protein
VTNQAAANRVIVRFEGDGAGIEDFSWWQQEIWQPRFWARRAGNRELADAISGDMIVDEAEAAALTATRR